MLKQVLVAAGRSANPEVALRALYLRCFIMGNLSHDYPEERSVLALWWAAIWDKVAWLATEYMPTNYRFEAADHSVQHGARAFNAWVKGLPRWNIKKAETARPEFLGQDLEHHLNLVHTDANLVHYALALENLLRRLRRLRFYENNAPRLGTSVLFWYLYCNKQELGKAICAAFGKLDPLRHSDARIKLALVIGNWASWIKEEGLELHPNGWARIALILREAANETKTRMDGVSRSRHLSKPRKLLRELLSLIARAKLLTLQIPQISKTCAAFTTLVDLCKSNDSGLLVKKKQHSAKSQENSTLSEDLNAQILAMQGDGPVSDPAIGSDQVAILNYFLEVPTPMLKSGVGFVVARFSDTETLFPRLR